MFKSKGSECMNLTSKRIPKKDEVYKHYKGNVYKIIAIALHTETNEQMVIYQGLYGDNQYFARPLDMFLEDVELDGYIVERFTLQDSTEDSFNAFLDAKLYSEKIEILKEMRINGELNERILNNFAVSLDCVLDEKTLEGQYLAIMNCLEIRNKFQCQRLR